MASAMSCSDVTGTGGTYANRRRLCGIFPDAPGARSGGFAQRGKLAHAAEAAERPGLDLAHPLRSDAELAPDLAQRRRLAARDPVAHLHDLALPIGQLVQR